MISPNFNCVIIRPGELFLKGKNKAKFESIMAKNIKNKLSSISITYSLTKSRNLFYIENFEDKYIQEILDMLNEVFGIYSFNKCIKIPTNIDDIAFVLKNLKYPVGPFRVTVKRADKRIPQTSIELSKLFGSIVLKEHNELFVDLTNYLFEIIVDIRENGFSYIYFEKVLGLGGLPVSSSGKGLLLLSGGIDSPIAGLLMAKRGLSLTALHFHAAPYTSERALDKVRDLCRIISKYTNGLRLFSLPFAEIQLEIRNKCNNDYMITIMRRIMMRIAERLKEDIGANVIITGESLGQVASQTVEGLESTDNVLQNTVVLRPLIGFDKSDIIEYAKIFKTYETSILPYEDCCTIFIPKSPIIHPKIDLILKEENKLDLDTLIENSISQQTIEFF